MDGREIRLKRLFGDGRAVIIAMDHGMFDGPLPSMEDLPETERKINPDVDAVLISPGMIRNLAHVFAGRHRPLAVVRLNWNTAYCFKWDYRAAASDNGRSAGNGQRDGMDIALISLTLQTGDEERDARNIEIFTGLTNSVHQLGIPVIGEYFPVNHLDMSPNELHENVLIGTRIIAELGADAVKTFNTKKFSAVTGGCPVPVLGLGAEKLPTITEALQLALDEVNADAGGVVFGRNGVQINDPINFQAALCDVVRNGDKVEDVMKRHGLS